MAPMATIPARRRTRNGVAAALALIIALSGCELRPQRAATIEADDIGRRLESATGIALRSVAPPSGAPGLPELVTTLSGATRQESLTVLVFFEADATKRVLGSGGTPAGMDVLARSNIVVLYRVARGGSNRSRQVRRAIDLVMEHA